MLLNPDIIINLISLDHNQSETFPTKVSNINVLPTWTLLDHFTRKGLKKYINFSSFQVYGEINKSIVKSNCTPNPKNKYALSHYLSEIIVNYYNENTMAECINIRLSNSFGAPVFNTNNCWWLVVNDLVKSAYHNKEVILLSDGTPQRDFIDLYDVCNAIEVVINSKLDIHTNTFNLASGKTFAVYEIAKLIKELYFLIYKKEIPIKFNNQKNKYNESIKKYRVDISELKNLGYTPKNNYKKSIKELFEYFDQSI
jgi:UDP-glucose 4-epimerase